jgi:hypothetical protein
MEGWQPLSDTQKELFESAIESFLQFPPGACKIFAQLHVQDKYASPSPAESNLSYLSDLPPIPARGQFKTILQMQIIHGDI